MEFGWLSFLLLRLTFNIPFDSLGYIPFYCEVMNDTHYQFNSMSTAHWLKLERFLSHACLCLAKAAEILLIHPFYPQALGYNRTFKHTGTVRKQATLSRDWFVIWIGLLSYLITRVNHYCDASKSLGEGTDGAPWWFEVLATQGFPQDWLGDIYSSLACSFSPNTL
jgi:hypothetical protein